MKNSLKRIFIVGCPRSGTTLLQSLLGAHRDVATFPETHFFDRLIGHGRRRTLHERESRVTGAARQLAASVRLFSGYTSAFQVSAAWRFLSELPENVTAPDEASPRIEKQAAAYLTLLDSIARSQNKCLWLEKTPDHLFYVDVIRRYVPDAMFIHIIRNGADVVASLFDVARKHPSEDWQDCVAVDDCVSRWNLAVDETIKYASDPRHCIITYEKLVESTDVVVDALCKFIGMEFDPKMLDNFHGVAEKVALKSEPWKKANFSPIKSRNSLLFGSVFSESEQQYILNNLISVNEQTLCMGEKHAVSPPSPVSENLKSKR